MFRINHAVLHVLDFVSCVNVFSDYELDLADKNVKKYCVSHAKKALGSIDSKRGSFSEDSMFAGELRAYFRGERDFVDLSVQIAQFLANELGHMEKPDSCDLLVVDFEEDAPKPSAESDDDDLAAAYEANGKRHFGMFLLESRQAYMHEVGPGDAGGTQVDLKRHFAILPNPSQKVSSYALIELGTLAVLFADKPREISGEERMLIPDGLLQCSSEASSKELLDSVVRIAGEVADEYGANSAAVLSKAKAAIMSEASEDSEYLAPWDLGAEIFDDEPLQKRFEEAVAESIPERVAVEKKAVERVAKNHRIRTDTGIEITFPSEYSTNPDFIEFISEPNGLISIELKNIGSIENR